MSGVLKSVRSLPTRRIIALVTNRTVANAGSGTQQKWYSSKDGSTASSSPFSNSVILLQDGLNIEELPIAVRKANDTFLQLVQKSNPLSAPTESKPSAPLEPHMFKQCTSLQSVLVKLGELKTEQVSADVSLRALEKIAQSGQNFEFRNQGCMQQLSKDYEEQNQSFTLDAVVLQLGTIIIQQGSTDQLIGALKLITLPSFPGRIESLRKLLAEECLNKILDGKCSILQVCQAVRIFSTAIPQQGWADKCWVGLIGRDLSTDNIVEIYKILPYLKESQRAIYNHIERLLPDALHQLSVDSVLQILAIVNTIRLPNRRINPQIAYWLSLNLHTVSETGMKKFLDLFLQLNYYDPLVVGALERFLKVKSGVDQEFLSSVADYCSQFRVFVPSILNAVAEGFVSTGRDLNVSSIEAVVTAFGLLGYQPQRAFEFWITVESVLDEKLIQFRPESLLDVLLSCIYLERYPINFIPRLFSPHFLHRLSSQEAELTERCRQKIKLLDASMCLESSLYGTTHILPKDHHPKGLRRDGRIMRSSTELVGPLQAFCGARIHIHPGVVLCHLPLNDVYIVDLLLTTSEESPHFRYGKGREMQNRGAVAVLIHPPEHYVKESNKRLVGIQMMRDRQLKLLGFHVAHLALEDVLKVLWKKELLNPYFECYLSPHLIHI